MSLNELINPGKPLDIVLNSVQLIEGAVSGQVLTSDALGNAFWSATPSSIVPVTSTLAGSWSGLFAAPLQRNIYLSKLNGKVTMTVDPFFAVISGAPTSATYSVPLPSGFFPAADAVLNGSTYVPLSCLDVNGTVIDPSCFIKIDAVTHVLTLTTTQAFTNATQGGCPGVTAVYSVVDP